MALRNESTLVLSDLEKNIQRMAKALVDPQSGMSDALAKGLDETVVQKARDNVWNLFDTSGDFPSRITTLKVNQFRVDVVVFAVYAAVHEYGGTFVITDRQRGFFWAMWYATGNDMWKALALSYDYTIPARPYLRPALDQEIENAVEVASEHIYDILDDAVKI